MKLWPAFLGGSGAAAEETPFDPAATWERETYLFMRRSTRRAWAVAASAAVLAFLAMVSLLLVLPLKEFAPYVVTVDKNTGWLEVTRGLHQGNLTQSEAITIANIVRCLTARESFDATDYPDRYREVGFVHDRPGARRLPPPTRPEQHQFTAEPVWVRWHCPGGDQHRESCCPRARRLPASVPSWSIAAGKWSTTGGPR